jgi:hypothetical protein
MNSLKRWRLAGFVAVTILGFLLHYLYAWTGSSKVIGFFVPVNESVWEHLKLGYWSVVLFSAAEYLTKKYSANNYAFAKLTGIIAMEFTIVLVFYGYTSLAGRHIVLLDISAYIIGAMVCQFLTYFLLQLNPLPASINRLSLAVCIGLGVVFGLTTYYPPHIPLFKDKNDNTFGIFKEK